MWYGSVYSMHCVPRNIEYGGMGKDWRKRIENHFKRAFEGKGAHLGEYIRMYPNKKDWIIMEESKHKTKETCCQAEIKLAEDRDLYWPNGLNTAKCGGGWGSYDPKKTSDKLSKINKGRKHSLKSIRNMSKAHKGKKLSREHCESISKSHQGIKRISPSKKTREKISQANFGKSWGNHSFESRKKMSLSHIGTKMSISTKEKMSKSQRKRWSLK